MYEPGDIVKYRSLMAEFIGFTRTDKSDRWVFGKVLNIIEPKQIPAYKIQDLKTQETVAISVLFHTFLEVTPLEYLIYHETDI